MLPVSYLWTFCPVLKKQKELEKCFLEVYTNLLAGPPRQERTEDPDKIEADMGDVLGDFMGEEGEGGM
ncbi:MAG: hypothetical protein M3Y82_05275, partial [Verrucomicrobiota bacterium]|nr:hypothetical protein [Verrucomicrobiota bacterium]